MVMQSVQKIIMVRFTAFILALLIIAPFVTNAENEIPLLGVDSLGNLNKEYQIGRAFYNRLQARGFIETDPMVSRFLSDIGDTLLTGLDRRLRDYHFFIVRDESINAFALPGGYIGINSGLINLAQSEDQLASVMSHEIAHVVQRHGMQMLEKSEDLNLKSALTVLAAIVLSTQNIEAGSAALYAGIASNAQSAVNFTRANEYEADRLGVDLLKRAGYNASGMVEFFTIMNSGSSSGELENIEYIRTHPINANRIAEVASRVRHSKNQNKKMTDFQQFKDYVVHLTFEKFEERNEFQKGLASIAKGEFQQANNMFEKLRESSPDNIWFNYAYAENLQNLNKWEEAESIYAELLELYPDDIVLLVQFGRLQANSGKYSEALTLMQGLEKSHPEEKQVYAELVRLYDQNKNEVLKLLAEGNYHWFNGNRTRAVVIFKKLLEGNLLELIDEVKVKDKLALADKIKS